MRILLSSRAFPPAVGGVERFAESLAAWLVERGHTVRVATRTEGTGTEDHAYQILRRPSSTRLHETARWADVVHVNGLSLRGVGLGFAAWRSTMVTHHGHQAVCPTGNCLPLQGTCTAGPTRGPCRVCPERGVKGEVDVRVHAAVCGRVAANVAISEYLLSRLRLPRARMIYNPVSPAAFDAATAEPGQDGLVVFAGRLVREKGVELLLRAISLVRDARLEVIGDGPMMPAYRDLVAELGLSSRVSFLGTQPFAGLAAAYARAGIVCIPSLFDEPFGFVAAEAMAMGRPLVVTPSGALAEFCDDDRGFVAVNRDPRSIAATLQAALADGEERARRAARGRSFALEHLTLERSGAAYEALYAEAAA